MTNPTVPAPVPGPDTPTWTVDDDGWFVFEGRRVAIALCYLEPEPETVPRAGRESLRAAVRAARVHECCGHHKPVAWTSEDGIHNMARRRAESLSHYTLGLRVDRRDDYNTVPLYVHEGCGPATDTLRQARLLVENVDETAVSRDWVLGTYGAAQTFFTLGDLLDLLVDGGTDG